MSGFFYEVTCHAADGQVQWVEKVNNIMPIAGQNYVLSSALDNGARYTAWYVGIYTNAYTPSSLDTMITFIANAGEITTYDEANRVAFVPDGISTALFANYTSPALFNFSVSATARGGFLCSDAVKGSTSGVLISAALFNTPRTVSAGETLKVKGGLQLASV
jgi:hypothetical protein